MRCDPGDVREVPRVGEAFERIAADRRVVARAGQIQEGRGRGCPHRFVGVLPDDRSQQLGVGELVDGRLPDTRVHVVTPDFGQDVVRVLVVKLLHGGNPNLGVRVLPFGLRPKLVENAHRYDVSAHSDG